MTPQTIPVRLAIRQIDFNCLFDLTWGEGQTLSALIPFPLSLETQYKNWLNAYLTFYRALPLAPGQMKLTDSGDDPDHASHPLDWQAELVQAEVEFLYQFQRWLRHRDLFEIRAQIVQLARTLDLEATNAAIDLFVSADPMMMARFPWEQWELSAEFGIRARLRIARCPNQIKQAIASDPSPRLKSRTFRVLAILGDEQGLDFKGDRDAIKAMAPWADTHFMGWQPQSDVSTLKQDIYDAISADPGWDLLFFAGHSNEKSITGGEFIIGPNQVLSLQQLLPALRTAKQNGLQLAIFNSCSGLGIATRLLESGLSQVVVMREPIHNQVAHDFLQRFLFHLSDEKDAQDALHATCQELKLSQGMTYPSAYCLPSLFRHPHTPPFQLTGMRGNNSRRTILHRYWQPLRPSRWEAIALSGVILLSLIPSIQTSLLDSRLWVQAVFRELTGQIPEPQPDPPIVIISVDEDSLQEAQITQRFPMDRTYLARIIESLNQAQASLIGIDYLLDSANPVAPTQQLSHAIENIVSQQQAFLVFSSIRHSESFTSTVHRDLAQPNWSLSGDASLFLGYLSLPQSIQACSQRCPLGYFLALLGKTQAEMPQFIAQHPPRLANPGDLADTLLKDILAQADNHHMSWLSQVKTGTLTRFSETFGQLWFAPIIDFSIPKTQIYSRVSAQELLQTQTFDFSDSIVLVGAGNYFEATDKFNEPSAQRYWEKRGYGFPPLQNRTRDRYIAGVEVQGYMVHHWLTQRFVIPIPDIFMILSMAVLSKVYGAGYWPAVYLKGLRIKSMPSGWWISMIILVMVICVGVLSLQVFLSMSILIPWLLPALTMGVYGVQQIWKEQR